MHMFEFHTTRGLKTIGAKNNHLLQFIWNPYKDIEASIPPETYKDAELWTTCIPIIFFFSC